MSDFKNNVKRRYTISNAWNAVFTISTVIAVIMLVILLLNIINGAFGYVAIENTVEPEELIASGNLDELSKSQMVEIVDQYLSK
nr:hypothetical protein [Spirochaetaceae bacterium]